LARTATPSSSCLRGHRRRRGLLFLAVVASVLTDASSQDNPFTWVDCQTSVSPSPAPSPPPSSSSSANSSTFRSNVAALLDALPSAAAPTGSSGASAAATSLRPTAPPTSGAPPPESSVTAPTTPAAGVPPSGTTIGDKDAFEKTYYALMSRLAARVVARTPMFATGEAVYDRDAANGTMFGRPKALQSSPFERLVAVGAILYSPTPFEYVPHLPCRRCSKPSSPARPSEALLGVLAQK
ncbi:hypothetical protein EJB05_08516, partial [Eragrostis curvula]